MCRGTIQQVAGGFDGFTPHVCWEFRVVPYGSCAIHDRAMETLRFAVLGRSVRCGHLMLNAFIVQIRLEGIRSVFTPIVHAKQLEWCIALFFDYGFPLLENA